MDIKTYFNLLKNEVNNAYAIAQKARKIGIDPSDKVEIKIAHSLGERVEGLLGIKGINETLKKLEKSMNRVEIAFYIAEKIAKGELLNIKNPEERADKALRISMAILTEGVLVAPTEGVAYVKINSYKGKKYLSVYYAGPIRSAGGTVVAVSVLLADVIRKALNIDRFEPTDKEIKRIVEEINLYHNRAARLQYKPTDEELEYLYKHVPIDVNGEPTEKFEVSAYRNLERINTNRVRGGVALVLCEGLAQKAKKVWKYINKFKLEGWEWFEKLLHDKTKKKEDKEENNEKTYKYLEGLVAGRPVFAYPSRPGGFRLRYGKSFTNGIMAKNIHPATMVLLDGFISYGTQIKIQVPGKSSVLTGEYSLHPPIVKLKNGDVIKVNTIEEAQAIKDNVEEILFLGDILITYGDFLKSNNKLLPSPYVEEWWLLEAKEKGINKMPESLNEAIEYSKKRLPLFPKYIFFWREIQKSHLFALVNWLKQGKISKDKIILSNSQLKRILEIIGVEHKVRDNKIIIEGEEAQALLLNLGIKDNNFEAIDKALNEENDVLKILNKASPFEIRDKVGTYIGARMGRPEKAKERKMNGSPNVLFPTGRERRSLIRLYKTLSTKENVRKIKVEIARFYCTQCKRRTYYRKCHYCGGKAEIIRKCVVCGRQTKELVHCNKPTKAYDETEVDFIGLMNKAREKLGFIPNELKGVEGLMSKEKIAERLEKGFLRAKYGVYVFRDGTAKFDAIDLPLTHFRPRDVHVSIEKLKKLGYTKDVFGKPLEKDDQILALQIQDIVIPKKAADYLLNVSKFVDDELVYLYGIEPYYNLQTKDDLIGQLVIGMSPHTSAGIIGRIIGITDSSALYAHPFFHCAKRRNTDGDEDAIMLLMDAFLNFSKHYLSSSRGSTMDIPAVLIVNLEPREIDDEAHDIEIQPYTLEFYEATLKQKMPYEIKIKTVADTLNSDERFKPLIYTHDKALLQSWPHESTYKKLKSIPEKIKAELDLMRKIRAVDFKDAVEKIILDHFIPDIYGNLRQFSRQSVRCKVCNTIFRRPPLIGKCTRCGGELTLTIHKGTIEKYVSMSSSLIEKYSLPLYLKQRVELVKKEIESIFESDDRKQKGLMEYL